MRHDGGIQRGRRGVGVHACGTGPAMPAATSTEPGAYGEFVGPERLGLQPCGGATGRPLAYWSVTRTPGPGAMR